MPLWSPIKYREFCDQPRVFVTKHGDQTLLFDCPLDIEKDDWPDHYIVYLMPELESSELAGSWIGIEQRAIRILGMVRLLQSSFDPSIRQFIDLEVLTQLESNPE